ncbi:MAG: hypothetical protein WDN26_09605 [Chitinophagaceae bacterium]
MKFFLLIFSLITGLSVPGQFLKKPIAVAYTGLGAYSLQQADVLSFSANQASLAQIKNAAAGVYGERRFLLAELNNYSGAFALPTSSGNFGLNVNYYGFSDYNESQLGLAYARSLGSKVDLGVQFNYNNIRIAGYGTASAISFEIGTIMHITDQLHAGIHVNNPVGGKLGKDQQEKLPSVYTAGLGYEVSEKFFVSTEIIKEEDRPVNINAGMQYKFLPQLLARAGVATATSSLWLGVGLSWKTFRVDITSTYHPQLGITPGLLILFNFKNKEE